MRARVVLRIIPQLRLQKSNERPAFQYDDEVYRIGYSGRTLLFIQQTIYRFFDKLFFAPFFAPDFFADFVEEDDELLTTSP